MAGSGRFETSSALLNRVIASHMPPRSIDTAGAPSYSANVMKAELVSQFRIAGLVRSPDREGALAHFDPDRGFALTARSVMGPADVIDPTIWVKEKISLALSAPGDTADAPLRRVIGALRALHAELMARPEKERPWVSVLVLLLLGDDAVAVSARSEEHTSELQSPCNLV